MFENGPRTRFRPVHCVTRFALKTTSSQPITHREFSGRALAPRFQGRSFEFVTSIYFYLVKNTRFRQLEEYWNLDFIGRGKYFALDNDKAIFVPTNFTLDPIHKIFIRKRSSSQSFIPKSSFSLGQAFVFYLLWRLIKLS